MIDAMHFFDSPESFVLIVGQERKKLFVSRLLLEQIPFFNNALKGDQFKEATEKTFEMPEDDPKAVSDLLHFVFADHVKPIEDRPWSNKTDEEGNVHKAVAEAYVRAFIVADKFMAEYTANQIVDCLYDFFTSNDVNPDCIDILSCASLQHTKLYEFLIDELAAQIRSAIRDGRNFRYFDEYFATDSEAFLTNMASDTVVAVMRSVMSTKEYETRSRYPGDCFMHTHQTTEACLQLDPDSGEWM